MDTDHTAVRTLTLDAVLKCVQGLLPLPSLLEKFENLEHLSIANIGVSSLEQFPRLRNLHKLILSDNIIAGGLEFLVETGLDSLRDLDLSNNRIQYIEDLALLAQLKLVSLDLYQCPVTRSHETMFRIEQVGRDDEDDEDDDDDDENVSDEEVDDDDGDEKEEEEEDVEGHEIGAMGREECLHFQSRTPPQWSDLPSWFCLRKHFHGNTNSMQHDEANLRIGSPVSWIKPPQGCWCCLNTDGARDGNGSGLGQVFFAILRWSSIFGSQRQFGWWTYTRLQRVAIQTTHKPWQRSWATIARWASRERNMVGNTLAKLAHSTSSDILVFTSTPSDILALVERDIHGPLI
ncbi:Acidic leucine-rich nuclear phosphoprotein 32-related protein [Hibiscus syriacus]|uniref:Acidic leucine-rich nuclear phosphoprotein 32-related protein n=1 Tax=Hibiscus syriacus TaxID=106335 RepID=A0A6A3BSP0_HIBSY|nr:Acidic leucine-rich nuclear phosphoprotein 32-related protein [Hibiscus syriacus]